MAFVIVQHGGDGLELDRGHLLPAPEPIRVGGSERLAPPPRVLRVRDAGLQRGRAVGERGCYGLGVHFEGGSVAADVGRDGRVARVGVKLVEE